MMPVEKERAAFEVKRAAKLDRMARDGYVSVDDPWTPTDQIEFYKSLGFKLRRCSVRRPNADSVPLAFWRADVATIILAAYEQAAHPGGFPARKAAAIMLTKVGLLAPPSSREERITQRRAAKLAKARALLARAEHELDLATTRARKHRATVKRLERREAT